MRERSGGLRVAAEMGMGRAAVRLVRPTLLQDHPKIFTPNLSVRPRE